MRSRCKQGVDTVFVPASTRVSRLEARPERHSEHPGFVRASADDRRGAESQRGRVERGSSAPRSSQPAQRLAGLTVLVVDDDADSLDYFAIALRTAGATVTTTSTATEALAFVQAYGPDVVLSDIAMPGHDGYWLVRQIRHLPEPLCRVAVVATTAYGWAYSPDTTMASGFTDHIAKPVEPDRLWTTIARAAGREG
jgi:CheY-like chemotaxis protein